MRQVEGIIDMIVGEWGGYHILKMSFSVGVSMYMAKVTSYWYILRRIQRMMGEKMKSVMVEGGKRSRRLFFLSKLIATAISFQFAKAQTRCSLQSIT